MNKNKATLLSKAIKKGINSGIASDFDPKIHLEKLKKEKHNDTTKPCQ